MLTYSWIQGTNASTVEVYHNNNIFHPELLMVTWLLTSGHPDHLFFKWNPDIPGSSTVTKKSLTELLQNQNNLCASRLPNITGKTMPAVFTIPVRKNGKLWVYADNDEVDGFGASECLIGVYRPTRMV